MKPLLSLLLLATLGLLCGCDRRPLPPAYGIYVRDGRTLSRMELSTPVEKRDNFPPEASIVIFDKRLSLPLGKPQDFAKILSRRYVRFNVDRQRESPNGPVLEFTISPANTFDAFAQDLSCSIMPVKGQPEMIELKATQPLPKGLYYLDFLGDRIPFGVGIGTESEVLTPYNMALDAYTESTSSDSAFSWDNWFGSISRNASGNGITYHAASQLDGWVQEWRQSFDTLLPRYQFTECAKLSRRLKAYCGDVSSRDKLIAALGDYAREHLATEPAVAVALANRLLKIAPNSATAKAIVQTGTERLELGNQSQAERKAAWVKKAHDESTVLFQAPIVVGRLALLNRDEQFGKATLTSTCYIAEWREWFETKRQNIWFGDVTGIEKYVDEQKYDLLNNLSVKYYGLEVACPKESFKIADFRDEQ